MTDCDDLEPDDLNAWHHVKFTKLNGVSLCNLLKWCEQTPGGSFYWTITGNFWFEHEADAVAACLIWNN